MNNDAIIVEVNRLNKHFKSGPTIIKAVDEVSFKLPRGKMIAIKGMSGSGKSTLLNLLGALDKPTTGTIVVDGVDVSSIHGKEESDYRLRKVGFVFQSYYLVPGTTALENVMLPMDFLKMRNRDQQTKAAQLLKKVGIDPKLHSRRPTKLSGGEQQRVAIARALANDPTLILADEPTGNLDSKTGQTIVDLLHDLVKEGRTVVLATHDPALAERADIVMEMQDGKLINNLTS
jgi:ABC-type lipoprotein export system ATPase subunit